MRAGLIAAVVACAPGLGWAEEFLLPARVASAEVFPSGAALQIQGRVDVPVGRHEITVLLPRRFVEQMLPPRVEGAVMRGVSIAANTRFDPMEFAPSESVAARNALDMAEEAFREAMIALDTVVAKIDALGAQAAFLQSVTGGDTLASAEELVAVAGAIAAELGTLATARRELETNLPALKESVELAEMARDRARAALDALAGPDEGWLTHTTEVEVVDAGPVTVAFAAFAEAGWDVSYELHLNDAALRVDRRVQVFNAGPLPWLGASVTLSTAEPFGRSDPTEVARSIARLVEPAAQDRRLTSEAAAPMMEPMAIFESAEAGAVLNEGGAVVRYDLRDPVTVLPGSDEVQISLTSLELPVERYLLGAPRFDTTAFHMADVTNDTGEVLLVGEAVFYRDGALIADGFMPLLPAGDAATLGFGPERSLALNVEFLDRQEGDRGIIRGRETRAEEIRLSVRNLGDEPRDVRVRYAVPTSQQEDLTISVGMNPAPTRRDVEDQLGVMEWELSLPPQSEAAIELEFELAWPEGQTLVWRP